MGVTYLDSEHGCIYACMRGKDAHSHSPMFSKTQLSQMATRPSGVTILFSSSESDSPSESLFSEPD